MSGEKEVHEVEGKYVPIYLLGQLGADEKHLHDTISAICAHANLTPRGAAAHLAHAAHAELTGGARIPMKAVIAKAKRVYGPRKAKRGGLTMGGMAMGGMDMGGYDAMYDGGFSFSDFMSGARRAADKAREYVKKAIPVAQAVHSAIPAAASVLGALGLRKAADAATSAHAQGQRLGDEYGSYVKDFAGAGLTMSGRARGGLTLGGKAHEATAEKHKVVGTKEEVYKGFADRTAGGLRFQDLMKHPDTGKIMSKRQHAAGLERRAEFIEKVIPMNPNAK